MRIWKPLLSADAGGSVLSVYGFDRTTMGWSHTCFSWREKSTAIFCCSFYNINRWLVSCHSKFCRLSIINIRKIYMVPSASQSEVSFFLFLHLAISNFSSASSTLLIIFGLRHFLFPLVRLSEVVKLIKSAIIAAMAEPRFVISFSSVTNSSSFSRSSWLKFTPTPLNQARALEVTCSRSAQLFRLVIIER